MNEVEAVARAVAPMMEGGREFDQMPPTRLELRQWSRSGMCSTNDATQDDATELAQAAIAALDAARGDAEPDCAVDAWLAECTDGRVSDHTIKMLKTFSMWAHAHPPRGDQVARVVEWLRKLSGDEPLPTGCTKGEVWVLRRAADAIERGEPFNG